MTDDLRAELQELRLQCLAHETQAQEAYAAQQRAEAKLAKAMQALSHIQSYDIHAPTYARNALAALKGQDNES